MADPVQCVECDRFNLRADPKMARLGFGLCSLKDRWVFMSATYARACDSHKPAKPETITSRRVWLEKADARKTTTINQGDGSP